jgi:glycosyltransferase involved in cell wall biosynthesis
VLVMSKTAVNGQRRGWFTVRRLGAVLLLLALLIVAPYLRSGTELVRLRNALSLGPDMDPSQDWSPPAVPAGYLLDKNPAAPAFAAVAQRLGLADLPDDWTRGLAISRHLLGSASVLHGGPIQKNLHRTYEDIVQRGDGYCGDFVRAYLAIAHAAGMMVRPWAFSFDGFGGHGHIWVEVWNRQLLRWQLQDVFDNFYYVDGNEQPLSALELRTRLAAGSPTLQMRLLHPGSPPGYVVEEKGWDYLRRGLNEWYMPWGNNVFAQDQAPGVQAFSGISRAAEGVAALVSGVQPDVRLMALPGNEKQRARLHSLRHWLLAAGAMGSAGLLLLVLPGVRRAGARRTLQAGPQSDDAWPVVCIVGPLPPPSGGMANQCEQLQRLLRGEGVTVGFVRTNAPCRPQWIGRVPVVRAGYRLLPYLFSLWRGIGQAQVVHLFANSGWAWHLLAAPALQVARWRSVPVIINYRGGLADEFFTAAPRHVLHALAGAAARVTPSAFLVRVFAKHGLQAEVIPNIIDLSRFQVRPQRQPTDAPHLVVTRNLEAIYDIATALQAFAQVRLRWPAARLTVAGTGPEEAALRQLAVQLGLGETVHFAGRIDNADISALYCSAAIMLNPSTADNMPISILEALACGVPVVSTDAGGIPDLVQHERTALLVPVGDAQAMAAAALRLLDDAALAQRLHDGGVNEAARYAWPRIRGYWLAAYRRAASSDILQTTNGHPPRLPR